MSWVVEKWAPVVGYEGRYLASSLGRILSLNFNKTGMQRLLIPRPNRGYPRVCLYGANGKKSIPVHAIVAAAFLGERPVGHQINHRNGVKTDNACTNLEYCTSSANQKHSFALGLQSNKGERHSHHKLTDERIGEIRKRLRCGESQSSIARAFGVVPSVVCRIANNRAWAHVKDVA